MSTLAPRLNEEDCAANGGTIKRNQLEWSGVDMSLLRCCWFPAEAGFGVSP
jgi:hypothetical protein